MRTNGNGVLITGGSTGIGLALGEVFLQAGNDVAICGRRPDMLDEARRRLPRLNTLPCDVADPGQRVRLVHWAIRTLPDLNVLINNAGIQLPVDFHAGAAGLESDEDEIDINLKAPVRLAGMLIPHLARQAEAAMSDLLRIGICAAGQRAGVLRHQGGDAFVMPVFAPPVTGHIHPGVRDRAAYGRHRTRPRPPRAGRRSVTEASRPRRSRGTLQALESDTFEAPIGGVDFLRLGARTNPEQIFQRINGGSAVSLSNRLTARSAGRRMPAHSTRSQELCKRKSGGRVEPLPPDLHMFSECLPEGKQPSVGMLPPLDLAQPVGDDLDHVAHGHGSPAPLAASVSMIMQKGQATASVLAPVACASLSRASFTRWLPVLLFLPHLGPARAAAEGLAPMARHLARSATPAAPSA